MSTNFSLSMHYSIIAAINKPAQNDTWPPRQKTKVC